RDEVARAAEAGGRWIAGLGGELAPVGVGDDLHELRVVVVTLLREEDEAVHRLGRRLRVQLQLDVALRRLDSCLVALARVDGKWGLRVETLDRRGCYGCWHDSAIRDGRRRLGNVLDRVLLHAANVAAIAGRSAF